jgi:hypothetical protein
MKLKQLFLISALTMLTLQAGHASTFYKWVDAQGATHYSQQPQYNVKNQQTVTVYKDTDSFHYALGRLKTDGCQIMRDMMPQARAHMDEYNAHQRMQVEHAMDVYNKNCY